MLKTLKRATLRAASQAGFSASLRSSRWRGERLLILAYHGISLSHEHIWDPALYVDPTVLRRRFEILRDGGFEVLPLDEALLRLRGGTLPPRAVAITFDDGARDFGVAGVPLLQEFGYPATLYLTTFYCQHQRPVFSTMCRYLLWRGRDTTLDTSLLGVRGGPVRLRTDVARLGVFHQVVRYVARENLDWVAKDELLSRLAAAMGIDYGALCASRMLYLLTPEEVSRLPADLIDVQLHTHRHRVPMERGKFVREIEENRAFIAQLRPGTSIRHFCYPSGVTDPRVLPWLRETHVVSATTGVLGLASKGSNPLLLPRLIDTSNLIDIEFSAWLDGVAALLPRRPLPRYDE